MTWECHLFNCTNDVLSLSADDLQHGSWTSNPPLTIAANGDGSFSCDSNFAGQLGGSATYTGPSGGVTISWDFPVFGSPTKSAVPSGNYTIRNGVYDSGENGGAMFFIDPVPSTVTVAVAPSPTPPPNPAVVALPTATGPDELPQTSTPVDPGALFDSLRKTFPDAPRDFLTCLVGHGSAEQGFKDGKIPSICWNYMGFEGSWHKPYVTAWTSTTLSPAQYQSVLDGSYKGSSKYKDIGNNQGWGTGKEQLDACNAGKPKLIRNGSPRIWQYVLTKRPAWRTLDSAATEHANWLIRRIKALKKQADDAGSGSTLGTLADSAYSGDETAYGKVLVVDGMPKYNSEIRNYDAKVAAAIVRMRPLLKDHT